MGNVKFYPYHTPFIIIYFRWIKDLNMKDKPLELSQENIEEKIYDWSREVGEEFSKWDTKFANQKIKDW